MSTLLNLDNAYRAEKAKVNAAQRLAQNDKIRKELHARTLKKAKEFLDSPVLNNNNTNFLNKNEVAMSYRKAYVDELRRQGRLEGGFFRVKSKTYKRKHTKHRHTKHRHTKHRHTKRRHTRR